MNSIDRVQKANRLAEILTRSREDGGKTQEYMAKALGVTKRTIQNWESGIGSPSALVMPEWFEACGVDAMRYTLNYTHPQLFANLHKDSSIEDLRTAILEYFKACSDTVIRQQAFVMFGEHGSDFAGGVLQLMVADCNTSLKSRVSVASSILNNFEIEMAHGELATDDNILPDVDLLRDAIAKGKQAAMRKEKGYTVGGVNHE